MSVMRKALLWASTNAWIRENAMRTGFVRRSVSKFMPGERIEDAITAAQALKPSGLNTIFTRLGENISRIEEADEVREHYLKVIDLIQQAGIDAQISIKPTQLGYDQDFEVCVRHCLAIIDRCEATGTFFWIDMEGSPYVDGTIALFKRLRERTPNIGIAIQAYLYRTEKDVEDLVALGSAIRMVKGAYLEPADIAFPNKADVDENYYRICERLLRDDNVKPGALTHFGTHDVALQERILKLIAERGVESSRYEWAMLYGIQNGRQQDLIRLGQRTRCLISYGEFWFPWYMRRLAERPANVWFVLKNMFSR